MEDIKIDETTGEVIQKRGRGRPKKTEIAKRVGATFPGDKNGQFEVAVKDSSERQELVAKVLEGGIQAYSQVPTKDDQEAALRIESYFRLCAENGRLPTVEGLALTLGVTRQALLDWENGKYHQSRGPMIARAKELIAEVDAQLVAMGKMPAVPYIFRAKNYYGMTDKTEVQVSASTLNNLSEEELKKSIRDSVVIEAEFEEK